MGRSKLARKGISLDADYELTPTSEYRVKQIVKAISKGRSRYTTIEKYSKEWGISESQTQKYYAAALESLCFSEGEWQAIKHQNLVRLEKIYEDAISANDRKNAIAAVQEINKMAGVTGGSKVDIKKDAEGNEEIVIAFD